MDSIVCEAQSRRWLSWRVMKASFLGFYTLSGPRKYLHKTIIVSLTNRASVRDGVARMFLLRASPRRDRRVFA